MRALSALDYCDDHYLLLSFNNLLKVLVAKELNRAPDEECLGKMWYYADLYLEDVLLYRVIKLINLLLSLEQSTADQVPIKRCLYG